jgi:type IV pilus assembly protein PilE
MTSRLPRRINRNDGFTLLEIMIAVAIIGILTAIALPSYSDYLLRGRLVDAASNLSSLRVKLEQVYQDNRSYGAVAGAPLDGNSCPSGSATATTVTMLNAAQPLYWTYSCGVNANGQQYVMTATGQGTLSGFQFTLDQSNARQTFISGTAASNGYATPATNNCWVRKKPSQC